VKYGRSLKESTPRKNVRAIQSKNISVSAAVTNKQIITFKVKDSAYNAESFLEFIKTLCQKLISLQIVAGKIIMDNASIHKGKRVRYFVEQQGFELIFLPPCSPQLNPIEEIFPNRNI